MLGNHLLLPISFLDAALAANQTYRMRLPFGVTIEGVNAAAADPTPTGKQPCSPSPSTGSSRTVFGFGGRFFQITGATGAIAA